MAVPAFFQGFETDTAHWYDTTDFDGAGTISRVASGSNGIASATGSYHAEMLGTPPYVGGFYGPYADYGNDNPFNAASFVTIDLYLDTAWSDGTGFDLTTGITKQDTTHLRDFIFHVGVLGGDLLVNASNNTDYEYLPGYLTPVDSFAVPTTGWYTLEFDLADNAGALAVNMNLRDTSGLLWTKQLSDPGDLISTVAGGPEYSWFTYISADNGSFAGVAADNHEFYIPSKIPEPSTLLALAFGVLPVLLARRRSRC